jgi:hypothetical protein
VYASAIKPGQRFTDEQSLISITKQHGLRLIGKNEQILVKFTGETKIEQVTKDINKEAKFKIELSEN